MLAQQSSSPSTRGRYRQAGVRSGLALIAGALAVGLIACGGGTAPEATNSAAPPATKPTVAQAPPGAFGTAAAVSASSLEVQNPSTGQVTVNFSSSTTFSNTVSGTLADVTAGSCVTVSSTATGTTRPAPGTPITARTVTITTPGPNGCTAGAGGFRGGNGTRPSGSPRPSGSARPSGTNGKGGGNFGGFAFGSVSAVTSTGFTVHGVARGQTPATDTTVTVNSSTTYSKVESATSSALAVGDCVAAVGSTDDTGAVTAKSIAISKPGPNGCSQGFGGGRFRGNGGGTGGGNG
ncbi:MAG TPA: DUF5666 domain-containing protein [Pseudonocardiaceae bacterium]|nr:DUF5666 domain-containing protein [Pseudonocardiaceae bacterium]